MKKIAKNKKQTKKILEYTAVFEREKDGRYSVSFPSLPGCVTFGNDLDHAQKMAQEVLEL
jgi:predicted RNase H-like HicB family nuclease